MSNQSTSLFQPNTQQANSQKSLNSEVTKIFQDFKKHLQKINGADLNLRQMETLLSTVMEIQRIIQQNKVHEQIKKVEFKSILKGLNQNNIHIEIDKYEKNISDLMKDKSNLEQNNQQYIINIQALEHKLQAQGSIDQLLDREELQINYQFENEQLINEQNKSQIEIQDLKDKLAECEGKILFLKQDKERI